jgi:Mg2+-importing ATPase
METISPANTQSKEPAASYSGLSTEEASRRLAHYGLNEPVKKSHRTAWHELLALCTNPLVIILLLAAVIAAGVGEFVNSSIIVTIVALSITLDFFQTYRSERALSRLRAHVAVTCTVLRDGKWIEILVKHVVPGDLIRLGYGDMVPADAQILTAKDLHLQEAALTGESLPVEKVPTVEATASENNASEVYFGTSVVSGLGTAMVIRTGALTKFSEIAVRLAQQRPETEFELGLRKFGALIMRTVVLLVLFVSLVMIVLRHDPLESLLFALALAVGLTPEFLPMITTVTLAKGAQRMAKEHVIVKHLPAI